MPRFRLRTLFVVMLIAALGSLGLSRYLSTRPPIKRSFSVAALQAALADGKQVLVTVDADWAMNPSIRPRFMSPDVAQCVRQLNIETLTADWTRPTPAVDSLMQSLGATTVPTLALFSPEDPTNPVVLSGQSTDSDILHAINGSVRRERGEL